MSSPYPKTALFLRCLEYGGAERQAVNLARGLSKMGWPVSVFVFYSGGPLQADLKSSGIKVVPLEKRGRWDMGGFAASLVRALRREKVKLLYSFLDIPNLIAALMRPAFPSMKIVWGVRASNMDLARYDRLSRAAFKAAAGLSPWAHLIIANSEAGRQYHMQKGFRAGRFEVIHNGVDTEAFSPDAAAGRALREQWGAGPDEPLVGLVGRLDPMKGHEVFLMAAAQAAKQRKGLRFVCVGGGDGNLLLRMRDLAERMGIGDRVIWAGPRDDMRAVYNALDLLASTSSFGEGFSNAISEAMACGKPCVVSDVGDSALIVDNPNMVFRPGDWQGAARGWLGVLDMPALERRRLGDEARRRIVEVFSVDRMVTQTAGRLSALAGGGIGHGAAAV